MTYTGHFIGTRCDVRNQVLNETRWQFGSGMVSCFSSRRMNTTYCVNGIMDSHAYENVLEILFYPFASFNFNCGFIVQKDTDPKHHYRLVKQ